MRLVLALSCWFVFPAVVLAQRENIPALRTALNRQLKDSSQLRICIRLSGAYLKLHPDSSLFFAEKAEKIRNSGSEKTVKEIQLTKGMALNAVNRYSEGLEVFRKALSGIAESGMPAIASRLYTGAANSLSFLGDLGLATEYYTHALELAKSISDQKQEAEILNKMGGLNAGKGNLEIAEAQFLEALKIRRKLKLLSEEGSTLSNLGLLCKMAGKYTDAKKYLLEAITIREKTKEENLLADSYLNYSAVLLSEGWYSPASDYLFKALKLKEKYNDKVGITRINLNLGFLYYFQSEDEKAREYFKKVEKESEFLHSARDRMIVYSNLAALEEKLNHNDDAESYYFKAKQIAEELDDKKTSSAILLNLAFLNRDNPALVESYFLQSIELAEKINDGENLIDGYTRLTNHYSEQNNLEKAEFYLKKAMILAQKENIVEKFSELYRLLYIIYEKKDDFVNALKYYKQHVIYNDSVFNNKHKDKLVELQQKYDTEKKDHDIILYKNQMLVNQLGLEKAQASLKLSNNENMLKQLQIYTSEEQLSREKSEKKATEVTNANLQLKSRYQQAEINARNAEVKRGDLISFIIAGILVLTGIFSVWLLQINRSRKKTNSQLSAQKTLIEEKNKNILQSINYAKRIQEAILPNPDDFRDFGESFIIYHPKDIVSGDFYWFYKKDEFVFAAVVDCTGHGVPGAFMSIVGNNGLNRIVGELDIRDPADILENLNHYVVESLKEHGEKSLQDGMDISLIRYNKQSGELVFSGANRPVFLFRENMLSELKPDKSGIGGNSTAHPSFDRFTSQIRILGKGDRIYMFTDGISDQFNNAGKKFKKKQLQEMLINTGKFPLTKQGEKLNQYFLEWKSDCEQTDDVLLIGFCLN